MVEATSTPDGSSSDSVVLCSQNGSSSAHWQHCDGPLNYVCIKDMSYILIEELQKQGEHSVKVTEKFGYIALHQYPPWFETNSHFHVSFLMKEDLSIWLSVLWINLLSDEEGGCIDHLQIYDPDPSSDIYVDICGSPPGFNLFLSRHVSMNVSIGVLRADRAQDTTGFSMVFEAVDCSQIECTPGCGSTSLEYTPSEKVLRTMNFPSKLQAFSDCNTTIDAPQDTFIAIKFLGYQIRDPTSGKCEDRIIFTSPVWSHPIEFLCRDDIPPVFFTNASRISVELVTGFEMVSSGFTADVEFFKKPACVVKPMETCDSSPYDCEGTSGVITSPNYPWPTHNHASCHWNVRTPKGSFIRFWVTNSTFSDTSSCEESYLRISEDIEGDSFVHGDFCRDRRPNSTVVVESFLNEVDVELRTNGDAVVMLEFEAAFCEEPSDYTFEDWSCPDADGPSWMKFADSCYRFVNHSQKLTWEAADRYCRSLAPGCHLVSIGHEKEMKFIHANMVKKWTQGGTSTYIADGTDERPVNEPDGGRLDGCVTIKLTSIRSTALWSDIPCLSKDTDQFICELPATSASTSEHVQKMINVTQPTSIPACPPSMFSCDSGECVHLFYQCDNILDCRDGSDEQSCENVTTSDTLFFCNDGTNISISHYCDNVTHCADNSDEHNCKPYNCSGFGCDNGRCIPFNQHCDLVDNCFDGSDEANCEASNVSFTCYNGDIHPRWAKCDGIVDCIGGSFEDEPEICGYRKKNHSCNVEGELQCNNGACVSADILCIYDISQSGYVKGCRDLSHLRSCEDFQCPEYTLKCPNSYCIPLRFRCNGRWDCIAGQDELNCDTSSPSLAADHVACPKGTYKCHSSKVCLPQSEVCDGFAHCPDKDDEQFCVSPTSYPFLAELELVSSNIELIPAAAFSNNGDLYSLSLLGNPISKIEKGAFSNLKNLRKLDLRDTDLPINSDIREALQEIKSLHTIYADTFTMCCIMELTPADSDDTTGCFAPADEFSSCSDLLKDTVLRISMWILGISAMAGNIFVIGLRAIRRHQVETSRIQSRLITHLAISDFFMGCYMMAIAGADFYFRGDYAVHADAWRASLLCRLAGFISTLSSEVSVFIIMLISLDRILCIVFVHHPDIQFSNKSCKIWLVVVWVISLVISIIPAVVPIPYFQQFYGKSSVCLGLPLTTERLPGWEYSISLFLGLNLVCFVVTAFCYVAIFVAVRRSAANFSKSKDHGRHTKRGMQVQVKLAAKMALIVGTDFICWMPIIIMGFLSAIRVVEIPADVYAWTAVFILPLNSSLNPYLYTLSTVWQRHRARQRANAKTDSDGVMETRTYSS
ncbi:uncharacterized protein [Diadema antillarum]|uniref:uncharacterized protein n=1 Tax=Diadema antillarum TaxID=105358 RepID=UPI003A892BDC